MNMIYEVYAVLLCVRVYLVLLAFRVSANLSDSYLVRNTGNPKAQSELGMAEETRQIKPAIDDLQLFGPTYASMLEEFYRKNLTIPNKNMTFDESPGKPSSLMGNISFTHGILILPSPFKFVNVETELRKTSDGDAVIAFYKLEKQDFLLECQYLVNVQSESMEGTFTALLRNFDVTAPLVVQRFDNRTCYFTGPSLDPSTVEGESDYKGVFINKHGFKDSGLTRRVAVIINTFIKKTLFSYYYGEPEYRYIRAAKGSYLKKLNENLCV